MAGKSRRIRRALLAAMRIALWFEEGKSNKIWVGEQMGAALRTTWGRRTSFRRSSSVKGFPTEEKAAAALTKAATKKEAEGYRRAPSNAHELLWGRIALRCEDSDGVIRVSEVGSSVAMVKNPWGTHYPLPGQTIDLVYTSKGPDLVVFTAEEVAIVIEKLESGAKLLLRLSTPAGQTGNVPFVVK